MELSETKPDPSVARNFPLDARPDIRMQVTPNIPASNGVIVIRVVTLNGSPLAKNTASCVSVLVYGDLVFSNSALDRATL